MKQKTSVLRIITLIVCILLMFSAGVFTLMGGSQVFRLNGGKTGGNFIRGDMNGDFSPPSGDGTYTRPDGSNMQPPSGNNNGKFSGFQGQTPGDFQELEGMGNRSTIQIKLLIVARYAVGVLVILFGVLAAVGTWLDRKWGKVMAVITAVIVLAYTIPTMLAMMRGTTLYFNVANIVLSIALVIFAFLNRNTPVVEDLAIIETG